MSSSTWKKTILGSTFVILSILYAYLLAIHGGSNWNLSFNIERIKSLENIFLSPTNFDYWNHSGTPVNLFMPWLTSILFMPLFRLGNDTVSYLLLFFVINLLTFISSYYFSEKLFRDTLQSFLFSIIYTLSLTRFNLVFDNQVSNYLILIFLPIVFYGLFQMIEGKFKFWPVFSLGMILISLTSPWMSIGIAVTAIIMILLGVFSKQTHNWKYWGMMLLTGFESLILVIISTLGYTVPLIEQNNFYQNKIKYSYIRLGNFDFKNYYGSVQNKYLLISAIFIILVVIVFALMKTRLVVKLTAFGVIITGLLSTDLIAWDFAGYDFKRLTFYFWIICIYLFCQFVSNLLASVLRNHSSLLKLFILLVVTVISCISVYANAAIFKSDNSLSTGLDHQERMMVHYPNKSIKTKTDLNDFIINGKKSDIATQIYSDSFEFKYYDPNSVTIDIPVLAYKGRHVQINNETTSTKVSKRGTIKIKTQPGANIVHISYQYSGLAKISLLVSLAGLLILCWLILNKGRWTIRKIVYNG
ncbi:glycosyltransferase family protein [Companilactobacillus jidongensis]|uniref:hypothetical protein n=1 Tax=Companilactobacillus jidongensis TaxID=2486006 RepID=UPI000F79C542|nr:hypothetical protein [Companilactobacillus jidongensis]